MRRKNTLKRWRAKGQLEIASGASRGASVCYRKKRTDYRLSGVSRRVNRLRCSSILKATQSILHCSQTQRRFPAARERYVDVKTSVLWMGICWRYIKRRTSVYGRVVVARIFDDEVTVKRLKSRAIKAGAAASSSGKQRVYTLDSGDLREQALRLKGWQAPFATGMVVISLISL